ncbi:hypothetical protein [Corynebacterium sp. CCM 9203]|uniref:hypothetical protein n=1 Tax=Corynebacterium sp. CCM 9203 TaxID=3057615 RepID=UPI00352349B7
MSKKLLAGIMIPALLLGLATPAHAEDTATGSSIAHLSSTIAPAHPSGMPAEAVVKFGVMTQEEVDQCRAEHAGDPDLPVTTEAINWMERPCPAGPITAEELVNARITTGVLSLITAPVRLVLGFLDFISSLFTGATSPE